MYNQIEASATIVSHAHGIKFEVINQTRGQLLQLRTILEKSGETVLILLPNNRTL